MFLKSRTIWRTNFRKLPSIQRVNSVKGFQVVNKNIMHDWFQNLLTFIYPPKTNKSSTQIILFQALKKQEQKINDLKKTLHRELKVQSLPNDEPIDPKMAALTPPLVRKNSATRNLHNSDTSRTRRQNSHERSPAPVDSSYGFSDNSNSAQEYFLGQSSHNHGLGGKQSSHKLPHSLDHATISVNDSHSYQVGAYSSSVVNVGDMRTGSARTFETKHLEKDVNFQYLKHVVMKFVLSREHEVSFC